MAWYHELASSLGALFGRRRQEHEMDEELRFHIEMEMKRHLDAGLSEEEARRRATRDFGGVERYKEDVRDERGTSWFYDGWRDIAFAARSPAGDLHAPVVRGVELSPPRPASASSARSV